MSTRSSFSSISTSAALSLEQRRHVEAREARLSTRLGIEGADAHESVDPALCGQPPVGEATLHNERRRQQSGLLTLGCFVDLNAEAAALGPARVHAQQHLGPVLGVGAAGAGVQFDDGVVFVIGAAEQTQGLEIGDVALERLDRVGELVEDATSRHRPRPVSREQTRSAPSRRRARAAARQRSRGRWSADRARWSPRERGPGRPRDWGRPRVRSRGRDASGSRRSSGSRGPPPTSSLALRARRRALRSAFSALGSAMALLELAPGAAPARVVSPDLVAAAWAPWSVDVEVLVRGQFGRAGRHLVDVGQCALKPLVVDVGFGSPQPRRPWPRRG